MGFLSPALVAALLLAGPNVQATEARIETALADPRCATPEEAAAFLDLVRVRVADVDPALLSWRPDAEGHCQLGMTTVDGPASLPLGPGAKDADLEAAAIRVAWWLELAPRPPVATPTLPPDTASPVTPPPVVVVGPTEPKVAKPATPWLRFGVGFGAAWYPSPGEPAGLLRVSLLAPVSEHLAIGLEARLGSEVLVSPAPDIDAYDRTIGFGFRYDAAVGKATLGLGFGARYAFPEFDSDQTGPVSLVNPASSIAVYSGLGLAYPLVEAVTLRADMSLGLSLGSRRLEADGRTVANLGVACFDLAVGFELAW